MSEPSEGRDPLEVLIESFLARYRAGERPSLDDYLRRHPEHAEEIRELFPALLELEVLRPPETPRPASDVPERLGDYRILRVIGRGGMGVVYEAVQESLGRHVALKVLPPEAVLDPMRLERFRREARAAARLHHTNIVPVFGVGEHEGVHFYAMQFIEGQGLDAVLRAVQELRSAPVKTTVAAAQSPDVALTTDPVAPIDTAPVPVSTTGLGALAPECAGPPAGYYRSVARLIAQAADALAYAHAQGVVHRDIKPANLLLDAQGTVWVADFGLAKAAGSDDLTGTGDILGTMRYMAPEQFHGVTDPRGDVYSLGLTLYEMLVLRQAFDQLDRGQLMHAILHDDPPRPRTLAPGIPRDLETIVLKAIDKDASRRFASAEALAGELRRFLADEPLTIRPLGVVERLARWRRRNPRVANLTLAVASLALFTITVVTLLSVGLFYESRRALDKEHEAKVELRDSLLSQARLGARSTEAGWRARALGNLTLAAQQPRAPKTDQEMRDLVVECLARTDLVLDEPAGSYPAGSIGLAVDAAYQRYAHGHQNGTVTVRRLADDSELASFSCPADELRLEFSPDGRFLAAGSANDNSREFRLWDLSLRALVPWAPTRLPTACWAFRPDGKAIALSPEVGDGLVVLHDLDTGKELRRVEAGQPQTIRGNRCAFSPDGALFAVSLKGPGSGIYLFEMKRGAQLARVEMGVATRGLALPATSPDPVLVAFGEDFRARLLFPPSTLSGKNLSWEVRTVYSGHRALLERVTFADDGWRMASAAKDGSVVLWDVLSGRAVVTLPSHGWVGSGPDGLLGAVREGDRIRLCRLSNGPGLRLLQDQFPRAYLENPWYGETGGDPVWGLDFSRSGRVLAATGNRGCMLWDVSTGRLVGRLAEPPLPFISGKTPASKGLAMARTPPNSAYASVAFGPDRASLYTGGRGGLERWPVTGDGDEGGPLRFGPRQKLSPEPARREGLPHMALSRDGGTALFVQLTSTQLDDHRSVRAYPLGRPGEPVVLTEHNFQDDAVALSPDGSLAAVGSSKGAGTTVFDARSGARLRALADGDAFAEFSPDGQWLVTGSALEYRFWRTGDWSEDETRRIVRESAQRRGPLAFTDDGAVLAVAIAQGMIRLYDFTSREVLATLAAPEPEILTWMRFSPDGSRLAVGTERGVMQLWELRPIRAEFARLGIDWKLPPYPEPPPAAAESVAVEVAGQKPGPR